MRLEGTDALWAYCVVAAGDATGLPELEGIEPGSAVETVVDGDLAALVSAVPRAEYNDETLREHLNELPWVERTARAHERVLERVLEQRAVVPLRLCTIFNDVDGVHRLLRSERADLAASLKTLEGRAEWGLKLFVDIERVQASLVPDENEGAVATGAAYLLRKQQQRDMKDAAYEAVARLANDAHGRLAAIADSARTNRLQPREAHGRDGDMILNGAYLVSREREPEIFAAVEDLRSEAIEQGIEIRLTGPWPGYNFVERDEAVAP